MKLIKNNKDEGFTLIELVVVIAILAILALILIPSLMGYNKKAEAQKNESNARNIYTAATLIVSGNPKITQSDLETALKATDSLGAKALEDATVDYTNGEITVTVGEGDTKGEYPKSADKKDKSN